MASTTAGIYAITPTSATGATIAPSGAITLSNAVVASVNGAFTTDFDNYEIVADLRQPGGGWVALKFRSAGADSAASEYAVQDVSAAYTAAVTTINHPAADQWPIARDNAEQHKIKISLFAPALARATTGTAESVNFADDGHPGSLTTNRSAVALRNIAAIDGFTIQAIGNAISGTIRVYGYNN